MNEQTETSYFFKNSFLRPEFGPLVLVIGEIIVFTILSSGQYLSTFNVSNLLAFVPELGMIALAMTLLMIAGEFDLSVGSVFGFAPVLMWTFYNEGIASLEIGFLARHTCCRPHWACQWLVCNTAKNPLFSSNARHVADRSG